MTSIPAHTPHLPTDYPPEKHAALPLSTHPLAFPADVDDLDDEQKQMRYHLRIKPTHALLTLTYIQLLLLGFSEGIVSVTIAEKELASHAGTGTCLGLVKALLAMSRLKIGLWIAFTTLDVATACLLALEIPRLRQRSRTYAMTPVRIAGVVSRMVLAMVWMHGAAAWSVLRGPFVSTFGKGKVEVDWVYDVVVPGALIVTFFFTFVWNASRLGRMAGGGG